MLKGWRTIILGLLIAIAPVAFDYLSKLDWTQYLPPNYAMMLTGVLVMLARGITNTPIGKK